MTDLLRAYDEACAVFSAPVRFVEWKMYAARGTQPADWHPFGLQRDRTGAWKEIEGERWIYVFRSYINVQSTGQWVAELYLDKGQLSATPMEDARVAPEKRAKPVSAGKTISFARRVNGHAMAYYFFAARTRLSLAAIDELQLHVQDYVPPHTFEPDDANLVVKGQEILVPVLDPITVAMHLHAYYVEAANDAIEYVATHKEMPRDEQDAVLRRQKKVLLARVLKAVVDGDKSNTLVNALAPDQAALDDFLAEYQKQVDARARWRDRWSAYLCNWLRSRPMKLIEEELLRQPKEFGKYLVPFCLCLTRTSESPEGRKLLEEILKNEAHFAHKYIFPQEKQPAEINQVARKLGSAVLEALKEWGPVIAVVKNSPQFFIGALQTQFGWTLKEGKPVYWEKKVQYKFLEGYKTEVEFEPKWEGAATKLAVIVEFINMAFTIKAIADAFAGDDPEKKKLAIIEGIGSALDLGASILSVAKVSERTIGAIAFVSGAIDTYLAAQEVKEAYAKGDPGARDGAYLVMVGSAGSAVAGLLLLFEIPGGQIVAIIGLAIVGLGRLLGMMLKKSDYELFVDHCAWGKRYGRDEHKPDWASKKFGEWKGDYDEQFRALINLICRFEIESGSEPREAELKMGFVPSPSSLKLRYVEKWNDAKDSRDLSDLATIEDGKAPVLKDGKLKVVASAHTFKVTPNVPLTAKTVGVTAGWVKKKNDDLQGITLEAMLVMKFGSEEFQVPQGKVASKTIFG